jgi:hypothetical protein
MSKIGTAPLVRRLRVTRAAVVATVSVAAGAATIVIADDRRAPEVRPLAEASPALNTRYFDTEANKLASMRALRRHIARRRTSGTRRDRRVVGKRTDSERAR